MYSSPATRRFTARAVAVVATALLLVQLLPATAMAVSFNAPPTFTGGSGTVTVGSTLYAKNGGALTLTVSTSNDTKCVEVSGPHTATQTSSPAGKTTWTFPFSAGSGDGNRSVTVAASGGFNGQGKCTGNAEARTATYTVDNTGPIVTAGVSPAPNAAGWNKADTTVTWTATDAGSGVASGPTPASSTETANGIVTRTSTATDRLGNVGNGSTTVRVDKTQPTITAETTGTPQSKTVTFTCADGAGESGISSCLANGSATNAKTVTANSTVTGTATDVAGNTKTLVVEVTGIDRVAPALTGVPTTSPNANGWYKGDVTIDWTATDADSGIPVPPADTVIAGEGKGLTSQQSVLDGAGNQTTATSPAVDIDRTAPTTSLTGNSNSWVNGTVTLTLAASDSLSKVDRTFFTVDGAAPQNGSSIVLSDEGIHTVAYWSTDKAGNTETVRTAEVKIDKTAPTISHSFLPASYTDGAWANGNVTVQFVCDDQGGSGLASCTAPSTVSNETDGTTVQGAAADNAGSTATDAATVRIDKTAPTIAAALTPDNPSNSDGWYDQDVSVSYSCNDTRSGIASCADSDVLGEGENQSASGDAIDAAGNIATAGVDGIDIDKTAPLLTGTAPDGWHNDDVVVEWDASDNLSGLKGNAPTTSTVGGEGDDLVAVENVRDLAGNKTHTKVTGIKIDRTAPTTQATMAAPRASGWYAGPVDITLNRNDNLSGVDTTFYRIDDGAPQAYDGEFSFAKKGVHEISFWSVDVAGNVEAAGAPAIVRVDGEAPATTAINPISPDSGWFVTSGIPFAFSAEDEHSGIAATYYTIDGGDPLTYGEPFTEDLSNGPHSVSFWSKDIAGNVEDAQSMQINVDTAAPSIQGSATPTPNGFGWNNTDVDVTFECADDHSGVDTLAGCAGDTTLANEGPGQSARGDALDKAGNRNHATVSGINIDKTPPTLTGRVPDANAAGWFNDDVTVGWRAHDGLSGIDPATQPDDTVIDGEGYGLGAGPKTVDDKAGNRSNPASVSGINIDRTAPEITGRPTSAPNAAGWYRNHVVVEFDCTDNLSGVASCPSNELLSDNGADQTVTSDDALDRAGNSAPGKSVTGINIDGIAPETTADNRCTKVNQWCTGPTADVVLTAADQPGLSGVKEIRYRVNNGAEQVAPGATTTVTVPLNGEGEATVSYSAVDVASNEELVGGVTLQYDNIAPLVTHTVSPAPNAQDWNKTDVTVHFDAKDLGSGVDETRTTADVTLTDETAGTDVGGEAFDNAGNRGADKATVRIDKTAPSIGGAIVDGQLGRSGWYVGPVKVGFSCGDELSGLATCAQDVTLTENGAGQSVEGAASDKADNSSSMSVAGINIDREKPTVTNVNVAGQTYILGAVPQASCTATDGFSGMDTCRVEVATGNPNGVGSFAYTATATDVAGNVTVQTGSFRVVYRFGGFLQPINDTAHQVGVATSVFKAGSTVPVKFQLRDAANNLVAAAGTPSWLVPVKGSAMSAPADETAYAASPDSGTGYKYDAGAKQYHYNWKSGSTGGNYWRIGVRLDDGQTYFVNIGLR